MIAVHVSVPVACWRKGHAREFWESHVVPPPATCYGALLSLVGETERERHRGVRITAGLLNSPETSVVLRTLWQIKKIKLSQGNGENAGPDFQQLKISSDLVLWVDSKDELRTAETLESRVRNAFVAPESVERFGGWSLGESTHLINDAHLLENACTPGTCHTFLTEESGTMTLPVWVDHVGSEGTVYVVGDLEPVVEMPPVNRVPQIPIEV